MLKLVNVVSNQAHAGIAQLVEQRTENPRVRGSNPRLGIEKTLNTDKVLRYTAKCEDAKNETKFN